MKAARSRSPQAVSISATMACRTWDGARRHTVSLPGQRWYAASQEEPGISSLDSGAGAQKRLE